MPTFESENSAAPPESGGAVFFFQGDLGIERLNDIRPHAASCAGTCASKWSSEVINDFSPRLRRHLLRHWGDPQRLEAIAVSPQHLEPEAVECEALTRLRDRTRLVNDEARDGSRLRVGQVPVHGAVKVADRN